MADLSYGLLSSPPIEALSPFIPGKDVVFWIAYEYCIVSQIDQFALQTHRFGQLRLFMRHFFRLLLIEGGIVLVSHEEDAPLHASSKSLLTKPSLVGDEVALTAANPIWT